MSGAPFSGTRGTCSEARVRGFANLSSFGAFFPERSKLSAPRPFFPNAGEMSRFRATTFERLRNVSSALVFLERSLGIPLRRRPASSGPCASVSAAPKRPL